MQISTASKLRNWTPLLDESHSQPLLASVREIIGVLETKVKENDHSSVGPELGEGAAAIAVFFAYLHLTGLHEGAADLAFQSLNSATEALATQAMGPSLYAGFAGITWAAEHVTRLLTDSTEDLGSDIDLALETYLSRSPWKADYDLIIGLVGLGVYCLERGNSPVARRCLELIVERLSELAEIKGDEICWFTGPSLLPPQQLELYPRGYYNLGLAHGVPGIIALLGKTSAAGIARDKSDKLLEGAVRWLLRQRLPANCNSTFPAFLVPEQKVEDCRLAWCYGDAGLAAALLLAARSVGNREWEAEAIAIAQKAASRDPQSCQVKDVCLCHGSAGLAHIFNRFYHATHDQLFAESCRYWLKETLQFRKPGTGAAGYLVLAPDEERNVRFQARFGLIEGIAGVGLSFLAALTDVEPCWDRIFMVDIPPLPSKP
jgi:lantibiotic biosynthesis protein